MKYPYLIITMVLLFTVACALPTVSQNPSHVTQTDSGAFYKHTRDLVRHEAVMVLDAVNARCFEACE